MLPGARCCPKSMRAGVTEVGRSGRSMRKLQSGPSECAGRCPIVRAMMSTNRKWLASLLATALLLPSVLLAEPSSGPYARIAFLRPNDGDTVDFEAGYIRHLEWHRQAKDTWAWYGWSIWSGERQRWFVYATFGH